MVFIFKLNSNQFILQPVIFLLFLIVYFW